MAEGLGLSSNAFYEWFDKDTLSTLRFNRHLPRLSDN